MKDSSNVSDTGFKGLNFSAECISRDFSADNDQIPREGEVTAPKRIVGPQNRSCGSEAPESWRGRMATRGTAALYQPAERLP